MRNFDEFSNCALEPTAGLKTVSMTLSYNDFMFDFRCFSENRRPFRLRPNP